MYFKRTIHTICIDVMRRKVNLRNVKWHIQTYRCQFCSLSRVLKGLFHKKGNALILNPLMRVCVYRKFTDLYSQTFTSSEVNSSCQDSVDRGQEKLYPLPERIRLQHSQDTTRSRSEKYICIYIYIYTMDNIVFLSEKSILIVFLFYCK